MEVEKWCGHLGQQGPRGGKINSLNTKIGFLRSTNFKLISQTGGKSIHNYDFFLKLVISVRGGYCDNSPRALKKLAMPLTRCKLKIIAVLFRIDAAYRLRSIYEKLEFP